MVQPPPPPSLPLQTQPIEMLTPERVCTFMLDLMGALAYLHSKGIVRR